MPSRQSSNSSSDQDGDSGRGLINTSISRPIGIAPRASYAKGTGHQSLLDIDSLYAKPRKTDKNVQVDISGNYEDVFLKVAGGKRRAMLPYGSGDGNEIYATVVVESNSKGTQARAGAISSEMTLRAKGTTSKKRKVLNHRLEKERGPNWPHTSHIRRPSAARSETETDSDSSTSINICAKPKLPPKPKIHRISDSEPELFSGSEYEMDPMRKRSMASMSELAEVTFIPENTLHPENSISGTNSDDTDWDNRSAISI